MAVPVNKGLAQSPHTWGRYSQSAIIVQDYAIAQDPQRMSATLGLP